MQLRCCGCLFLRSYLKTTDKIIYLEFALNYANFYKCKEREETKIQEGSKLMAAESK